MGFLSEALGDGIEDASDTSEGTEIRTVLPSVTCILVQLAFGSPVPVLVLLHREVGQSTDWGD
jgi:hypothetical protein